VKRATGAASSPPGGGLGRRRHPRATTAHPTFVAVGANGRAPLLRSRLMWAGALRTPRWYAETRTGEAKAALGAPPHRLVLSWSVRAPSGGQPRSRYEPTAQSDRANAPPQAWPRISGRRPRSRAADIAPVRDTLETSACLNRKARISTAPSCWSPGGLEGSPCTRHISKMKAKLSIQRGATAGAPFLAAG